MSTAEKLAFSIDAERRAVHVLLWDDQDDLVRALVAFFAALPNDLDCHSLFVSAEEKDLLALRNLVESRIRVLDDASGIQQGFEPLRERFWLLFLQQASSFSVGPWLNGWRRPLSEPPGAMLVIRHADFASFQRSAPDIASFIGARIFDSSAMLSVFSKATWQRLKPRLPTEVEAILARLPGCPPEENLLAAWIESSWTEVL